MYSEFLKDVVGGDNMAKFRGFDVVVQGRVDTLIYEAMDTDTRFDKLWKVIRKVSLLFHDQASLKEDSLLTDRLRKKTCLKGCMLL